MAYIYEGDINMRKKLFVVLAAVLLCFSLSACSFNWEVSFGKPAEEEPAKPQLSWFRLMKIRDLTHPKM